MSSKLNLEVAKGTGFNEQSRFALKFDIKNYDTSAVALSGLRVVAYSWLPYRNILSQFTSGTNAQGTLSKFTSAIDITNGVGQTGIVNLNLSSTTYRVYHNVVNSSKIAPQLTLNAPQGSSSYATVVSYANSTDTYFDIVINEILPTPGYTVTWFLPGSFDDYTGSTTNVGSPNITIEKVSEYVRINNRKFDSRFIFSWNGNTNLINPSWGLKDTDVYVQLNPTLYPSSNITSAWYSSLTDSVLVDNPYYVLEQWNGVSWNIVQEYNTSSTFDNLTGVFPTDNKFIKIVNNATGNNKSTYISVNNINPISANTSDKNNLSLWSKGSVDNRRRSLVKFETSAIPTSATGIKNAVLRLNVNSLSNAWDYYSTAGHISVYRVTTDWTENQATWSNRNSSAAWVSPGGDYDTTPAIWIGSSELANSFTSADQNKQFWVDFDVTSFVNYWRLNPSSNYGILVKLHDSINENNVSDIKWELNSGRLAGTGAISGFPQLLISYNSLDASGPAPFVEINSPSNNSTVYNTSFSISGSTTIASGQVEGVEVYYRPTASVLPYQLLGSLFENSVGSWYNTFQSLPEGTYDFILRAVSDLGNFGESDIVGITFAKTPGLTIQSDSICHSGSIQIAGAIDSQGDFPIAGTISYAKTFIPTDKKITSIVLDRLNQDVVWISTDGNGIYRVDKNSSTNRVVSFNTTNSSIAFDRINVISMDSQGILWIGYTSNGVGLFDTKNWSVRNFNDWSLFDHSNSSLSAYPANAIEFSDIDIDSNDTKRFSLTYQSSFSVIKLSGYSFNDTYATKYNISATPRSICTYGSNVYVSTNDNRLFKFNGSTWVNYTLPTFNNINAIDVDSNGVVWLATDTGFASFSATTFTELQLSASSYWPNGLTSAGGQLPNVQAKGMFVDSNDVKWVSFSTGVNSEYNGGVVRFDSDTITQNSINNNLAVLDSKNYSGILSNNIFKTINTSSSNLWVVTDKGLCLFDGYLWETFSLENTSTNLSITNNSVSATIVNPLYGNVEYLIDFEYSNGEHFTSSFYISSVQAPTIDIKYPTKIFNTVNSNVRAKILEYTVPDNDSKFGGSVATKIQKSSSQSGPWYTAYTYTNQLNFPVYETLSPEDFYYIKVESVGESCVSESPTYIVYGNNLSTVTMKSISNQHYSNEVITISGNVANKDFTNSLNVNGSVYLDRLSDVDIGYTTSAGFISIGKAIITGSNFSLNWTSPIAGVSSLSAVTTTEYGTIGIGQVTFSAIESRPTITIISPTDNKLIALMSDFTLSASTTSLVNQVSALNFHITNQTGTSAISASTSDNVIWTRTITPSQYGSGQYTVSATCLDIVNVSAQSNATPFTINSLPTVTQVSNLSATYSGSYSFEININDFNGFYNNRVEILSGSFVSADFIDGGTSGVDFIDGDGDTILVDSGTYFTYDGLIYTSGYANGFGNFVWNWNNPVVGTTTLYAKIYDGNPEVSADYYIYPFTLNLNDLSASINSFAYPSAKLNSVEISPKVNVVTTDTLITPSVSIVGSNVSGVNYWLCNYDFSTSAYYKQQILTSAFTLSSSREFITPTTSRYHFWGIVAEIVSTNGSSVETAPAYFYVKEQSVYSEFYNSICDNPVIVSGFYVDSDLPLSRSNTIIDNSVSAKIYDQTHNTYLGEMVPTVRYSENINYEYSWSNPISSVSAVSVRVVDSYGISATSVIDFGGIQQAPTISLLSATSFIKNVGNIYLVSAGTYNVSALTSATKIKDLHFIQSVSGITKDVSASSGSGTPFIENWLNLNNWSSTYGNPPSAIDGNLVLTGNTDPGFVFPSSAGPIPNGANSWSIEYIATPITDFGSVDTSFSLGGMLAGTWPQIHHRSDGAWKAYPDVGPAIPLVAPFHVKLSVFVISGYPPVNSFGNVTFSTSYSVNGIVIWKDKVQTASISNYPPDYISSPYFRVNYESWHPADRKVQFSPIAGKFSGTRQEGIDFIDPPSGGVGSIVISAIPVLNEITAYIKTSGNCVAYSDMQIVMPILPISANIYPDNCSDCYCAGGRLKITGNVIDPNYGWDLEAFFGRSISAYLYDNFDNQISDISSQIVNGIGSFEIYWESPTIGASSVYVKVVDNNGVVQTISKPLARSIYSSPTLSLISPIDYSISGTYYRQDGAITFESTVSSNDLLGVKYYVNGQLIASTNASNGFRYDWNVDKLPGLYSVSAVAINSNGCYFVSSKNIMVSNVPVINFIYPISGNYYQVGTQLSAVVDSKGNSPATVSAVSIKFAGSTFNTVYNSNTQYWETELSAVSSLQTTYPISAFSYDTLGRTSVKEIIINASNSPTVVATISGSQNVSANYNTQIPLLVSANTPNGGEVVSSYVNVSGTIIEIPRTGVNTFASNLLVPLYFIPGNNVIDVYVVDDVGAVSNSYNVYLFVNPITGVVSYPVIKNIGSSPMSKVAYRP